MILLVFVGQALASPRGINAGLGLAECFCQINKQASGEKLSSSRKRQKQSSRIPAVLGLEDLSFFSFFPFTWSWSDVDRTASSVGSGALCTYSHVCTVHHSRPCC